MDKKFRSCSGPVSINDIQIPLPPPSSKKVGKLGFCSKKLHNVLKPIKNKFLIFAIFYFLRYGRFYTQNS